MRIAVVGGGLSGLVAGYVLGRRGAEAVVYEATERLGGRALTDDLDGLRIDPGAQLFGSMFERFLGLVREVGLGERLVRVPGRDALWRDGRAHEVVYGSVTSMAASGGLPFFTKLRLGTTYVPFLARHGSDLSIAAPERAAVAGLDRESIASWGEREIDDAFVSALVYPQLGAYYAASPAETSAGFYHILARYGMDVSLHALDGGVGQLADRLASRIVERGGEVRRMEPVREVILDDEEGGAGKIRTVGEVGSDGGDGSDAATGAASGPGAGRSRRARIVTDVTEERFDGVVAAVPAPLLRPILRGARPSLLDWLDRVVYRPSVALVLLLDAPTRERYFGLSFPRGTNRFVAAVASQEHKGVPLGDTARGAMIAFATPDSAGSLLAMRSREILDRMLPEIAAAFPGIETRVTRARAYRWKEGAPLMYPGYLGRLGEFRKGQVEGEARLVVAGDYLYGPSVEGAVLSGYAAAARLIARVEG